jgi:DNA-binding PadR family transcriptional regulator
LFHKERHGYDIIAAGQGGFSRYGKKGPGTLYGSLDRMIHL